MAKKVTIKDIADMAGVSIATVSHVINRTRYVSPDLVEKIENIIIETGYHKKIEEKERRLKVGRQSEIVAVIPNVESTIYRDMVGYLKKYVSIQGYQFYIAITDNDIKEEAQVLEGLIQNKKTAGIIHVPFFDDLLPPHPTVIPAAMHKHKPNANNFFIFAIVFSSIFKFT
jgi:ribose transport system substrate-binding protein